MINTYYIKIVADEHYQRVECGGNTPALLEDAIKAAVKEFYKEGQPLPEDTVIFQKGVAEGRRLEREDELADLASEIEAASKRYPEVSFAKLSRIAKRFYELGKEGQR